MKKNIPETSYRASRLFRILGNPEVYYLVKILENKKYTPTELSKRVGKSLPTISTYLKMLKGIDVVRYETYPKKRGYYSIYWLKNKKIINILKEAEKFVEKMRKLKF